MRTKPSLRSLRWLLYASVFALALVLIVIHFFEQTIPAERGTLLVVLAGFALAVVAVGFFTFLNGIAILQRAIRGATEGILEPIRAPRSMRVLFGKVIGDYNILIRNMGSLFREMEQSQLAIIGDRNRNDAILRSLPGTLLTVDSNFLVTLSNKQAEQQFELSSEALQGKFLFDLLALNDEGRELLRDAFLYEQQVNNREILLGSGSVARYYTLNITFFRQSKDDTDFCAAVMLQDITDYKRMQEMIHQSEKFLTIGKLAGGVAHELNTPLGTIVGYAQLLNEGVSGEEKRMQYSQVIYREAKRCTRIIESLRRFAQRNVCQTESCEINKVICDVVEIINICPGKKHNVRIETDLATESMVRGADGQLDIVLVNVIMNAIEATAGMVADPVVTIMSTVEDDCVRVSITDNGPGVPQSQRSKVFDPFFTTKTNGNGSGLGLGLAISQSIMTQIGGGLSCDPEYSGGARFTLMLPHANGRLV